MVLLFLIYNEDCYYERLRIACLLFCSCIVFGTVSKFTIFNSGLCEIEVPIAL